MMPTYRPRNKKRIAKHGIEQREEVAPVGPECRLDDVDRWRALGIEDVIAPVGVENGAVGFAILSIRGLTVRRVKDREKIREEIDQHGGTIW